MSWNDKNARTREQLKVWNRTHPEVAKGFGALSKSVKEEGVLDFKVKEFVALGIAVSQRCEACIGMHTEALVKVGATRAEVADVLAMTIQMGGGPALMYTAKAMEAFDEMSSAGA